MIDPAQLALLRQLLLLTSVGTVCAVMLVGLDDFYEERARDRRIMAQGRSQRPQLRIRDGVSGDRHAFQALSLFGVTLVVEVVRLVANGRWNTWLLPWFMCLILLVYLAWIWRHTANEIPNIDRTPPRSNDSTGLTVWFLECDLMKDHINSLGTIHLAISATASIVVAMLGARS